MKRKVILMWMAVCVLAGCKSGTQSKVSNENAKATDTFEATDPTTDDAEKSEANITKLEETLRKFDRVMNIAYVKNNKLFVVADQIYLIDIISGEIVASMSKCEYATGEIKVYSDDTNIIIIGEKSREIGDREIVFYDSDDEESAGESVLYYDYQLNLKENINIYDTFGLKSYFPQSVAVSESGKLAVYDDECSELYLCDKDTKEKKKVFGDSSAEIIYDNKIQFMISGGIEFVQNEKRIAFKAECMDVPVSDGADSYSGIGSVTTDGEDFFVEKAGNEYTKLESFHDYAILSQDCGLTSPTGEVIKYRFDTDCTETIELKSKVESENVYCSQNGRILATSEENGEDGWNIRFYDADAGELLMEKAYEGVSSQKYSEPKIYVFDDISAAVVFLKSEDENSKDEFSVFQF